MEEGQIILADLDGCIYLRYNICYRMRMDCGGKKEWSNHAVLIVFLLYFCRGTYCEQLLEKGAR